MYLAQAVAAVLTLQTYAYQYIFLLAALGSFKSDAAPPTNLPADYLDFGRLFELLFNPWNAPSRPPAGDGEPDSTLNIDTVAAYLSSNTAAATEFLKYAHAKFKQQQGLEGLAAYSISAAWQSPLLRALAIPASVLLARLHAGARHHLLSHHLQPRAVLNSSTATATNSAINIISAEDTPTDADAAGGNCPSFAFTGPPPWLHPLLHQLRPDQVALLVSELLLHLAGLLEVR